MKFIFSDELYAALFNSKMLVSKSTTSTGINKQTNMKDNCLL